MEAALIIMALMVLFTFLGLGAWVTVKVVGAAKRGVDRTITQARRTVEDTSLKARSFGQVGVAGALAQMRLDLRMSMRSTQQALYQGVQTDASLKESIGLFERLSAHGHELDDELKLLEQEPDKKRIAERLPELRERAERVTQAADSLRWAARDRARRFAQDDLSVLSAQIEVESGALRDWSRESVDDLVGDPSGDRSGDLPGWAAAPPAAAPAPAPGPAAALPKAAARTAYPWNKAARPETTT
ncbi:hypothetical protein OHS33_11820 [Streptomyces sp. NBC_00536]|uniref:hypothetical protein n=1 Tax=Streptomyces sp. NBC_00536 TaxID=2975769 RepID=UPI002E80414C|nr:hypothetical protein [Streptomyces sp. NBC_00536]WUC78963.1 hypothetical protein OHS33_11820 [Streptomyces sp. NBC_00536]